MKYVVRREKRRVGKQKEKEEKRNEADKINEKRINKRTVRNLYRMPEKD